VTAVWPFPASMVTPASGAPLAVTVPLTLYVTGAASKSRPVASGPTVTTSADGANVNSGLLAVSVYSPATSPAMV